MKKFTILIIDDIETNLIYLKHIINDSFENLDVLEASNAKDAIEIIMKNKIDFIISDVQMPEISGFDLAKYLKDMEQTKDIPIVMISAVYEDDEHIKMAFESSENVIDFIKKPVNSEILRSKLKAFVNILEKMKKNKSELEDKEKEIRKKQKIITMYKNLEKHFDKKIELTEEDITNFLTPEDDYVSL